VADPSLPPLQLTGVFVEMVLTGPAILLIIEVAVFVHPLASVTSKVYTPEDRFTAFANVPPLGLQL
jgi:hypothetical protein